jgi:hypothetical protein
MGEWMHTRIGNDANEDGNSLYIGFEVLTVVVMKKFLVWDITQIFNGLHGVISQKKEPFKTIVA